MRPPALLRSPHRSFFIYNIDMNKKVILGIVILAIVGIVVWSNKTQETSNHDIAVYKDMVKVETPLPESEISSPLTIKGEARGGWFFEASFPVILTNWDGLIIAEGVATAQGEWMTSEYVPFEATLEFTVDTSVSNRGALILKKDNPSGLPEHDDAFEYTVYFK